MRARKSTSGRSGIRLRRLLAAMLTLIAVDSATAASISSEEAGPLPLLRINDPFTAPIWRIDVDANEQRHAVTGSADKAVTLWTLDEVLDPIIRRVPLRAEERQRAHASAISSDGTIIAYSVTPLRDERGYPVPNTSRIYILDAKSGDLLQTIEGDKVPNRPQDLRFSPDGRYLAAAISDGCGVRVWKKVNNWEPFAADDMNHGGPQDDGRVCSDTPREERDELPDTLSLLFPGQDDVWLVTSGATGVRTYRKTDSGMALILHKRPDEIGVDSPDGIALSPDGRRIAVGSRRARDSEGYVKLQIAILDLQELNPVGEPLSIPVSALRLGKNELKRKVASQYQLNRVAWGRVDDRDWVLGAGTFGCGAIAKKLRPKGGWKHGNQESCAVAWRLADEGENNGADEVRFLPTGTDQVMDAIFLDKKKLFLYATQRRVAAIDLKGRPHVTQNGRELLFRNRAADLRQRQVKKEDKWGESEVVLMDFQISDDARVVYFEDYRSIKKSSIKLRFDLNGPKVVVRNEAPQGLSNPNFDNIEPFEGWSTTGRPPQIYKSLSPLPESDVDRYRSAALDSDRRRAVVGSANFIRLLSYADGKPSVLCERRITAEALRVNITPDGKMLVVGHGDGVLRWYRIAERDEGHSCEIEHLLSVRISEDRWGDNSWTWIAWKPATGEYANSATAEALLSWQLTDKACLTTEVGSNQLTDKLYDQSAIKKALLAPPVTPEETERLGKATNLYCDPVKLEVVAPERDQAIDSEQVPFLLRFTGEGTWPRRLIATVGGGIRAAKHFDGKTYGPDEPILIQGPGDLELDILLPPDARVRHGDFGVQFELDRSQHVHYLDWRGDLVVPKERKLWAVLVGLSEYEQQRDLQFAQNDAVDLARLFAEDYKRRVLEGSSAVTPDFYNLNIDLLVSPIEYHKAEDQLQELGDLDFVNVQTEPTTQKVLEVFKRIREEHRHTPLVQDLVFFYFSGHGLANLSGQTKGRSLFLMPGFSAEAASLDVDEVALTSEALLEQLKQISADKVVVIDACRDLSDQSGASPFDPAKLNAEYYQRVHNAHFLLSAEPGQTSIDQGILVFNKDGFKGEQGNGLFTYAFLKSLTEAKADTALTDPGKIQINEAAEYVRYFFEEDPEGYQVKAGTKLLQRPVYLTSGEQKGVILRSLESGPSVEPVQTDANKHQCRSTTRFHHRSPLEDQEPCPIFSRSPC